MPILLANSELSPAPGIEQPELSVAGYPTHRALRRIAAVVVDTLSARARMLRNKKLLATSSTGRINSYL